MLAINIAASVLSLGLVYRVVERRSRLIALLALAVVAINPFLIDRAGQIASEATFMLFSVAAVCLLGDDARETASRRIAAGMLALAATVIRTAGIPLLMALAIYWLIQRRWKALAIFSAGTLATVGVWLVYSAIAGRRVVGESYVGDALAYRQSGSTFFPAYARQFLHHLYSYPTVTIPVVLSVPTIPGTIIDNIFTTLVTCGSLAVGLYACRRLWRPAVIYLAGSFVLLLIWPWGPPRFLAPLLPLAVPILLCGTQWTLARVAPRWQRAAVVLISVMLAVGSIPADVELVRNYEGCRRGSWPPAPSCVRPEQSSFFAAADWIREHLAVSEVVLFYKPETLAYYSARHSLPVRGLLNPRAPLDTEAREIGSQWLLLGSLSYTETGPLETRLMQGCDSVTVVQYFPPGTWLFRMQPPPTTDQSACAAIREYHHQNQGRSFENSAR